VKKNFAKKNFWTFFSKEELLVGSKSSDAKIPLLIDCENDHELYKEISKIFSCSRPLEIFSKIGKDNWILVDSI
jgi:Na+/H+-dicarboxylate symporters